MNTPFTTYTQLTQDIQDILNELKLFKNIGTCQASSWQYLINFADKMAGAPKAIICIGGGDYNESSLIRENSVALVCFIPFGQNFFDIIEKIESIFAVEFSESGEPLYQITSTNVRLVLERFELFDSEHQTNVLTVILKATEVIQCMTQQNETKEFKNG